MSGSCDYTGRHIWTVSYSNKCEINAINYSSPAYSTKLRYMDLISFPGESLEVRAESQYPSHIVLSAALNLTLE
jgi:hypothetical protein